MEKGGGIGRGNGWKNEGALINEKGRERLHCDPLGGGGGRLRRIDAKIIFNSKELCFKRGRKKKITWGGGRGEVSIRWRKEGNGAFLKVGRRGRSQVGGGGSHEKDP